MAKREDKLQDAASSVLMVSLAGTSLAKEEILYLGEVRPAGVILFKRNLSKDHRQITSLVEQIQNTRGANDPPLLIAVDQEGGRVSRLTMVPNLGAAQNLFPGHSEASLASLKHYGSELGKSLLEMGINLNFAPVVDILTNPENKAIGDRVFGLTAKEVSLRAGAFLSGMQSAGILGCLKHFPGQGDAGGDTHEVSVTIRHSTSQLRGRELAPFRALLKDAPLVMASHCIYSALSEKPASLSKEILHDLLRKELGFEGVIATDDMNMKALPQDHSWGQAIIDCLYAGNDLVLVCSGLESCLAASAVLKKTYETNKEFKDLINRKNDRILSLRSQFKANPPLPDQAFS